MGSDISDEGGVSGNEGFAGFAEVEVGGVIAKMLAGEFAAGSLKELSGCDKHGGFSIG